MKKLCQNHNQSAKKMVKLLLGIIIFFSGITSFASNENWPPKKEKWVFEGVFGHFDKQAIQRGFQVYKDVCAACHSLELIAFRNLAEAGLTQEEVKSLASQYQIQDGPDDNGEMYNRPGKPHDKIPSPYPNEKAARAANNGALPPDLSLIIKARNDGADYIYSLLTGYNHPTPKGFKLQEGMAYNPYFPGMQIAMPAPLVEGMVSFVDGKEATIDQMSRDVVNFLQWAAEPEMQKRKVMGLKVLLYLFVFTIIFYLAYKRIWSKIK